MPPAPKAPGLRARRNKASTKARLREGGVRAPALPIRGCPCGGPKPAPKRRKGPGRPRKRPAPCATCADTGILPWHHQTKAWWARLWASPMGPEYVEADVDRLFMAASLVDAFWWGGGTDSKLAGEIRLQLAAFGTSPIDRRKLDWELSRPPAEDEEAPAPPPTPTADPRFALVQGGRG